MRIEYLRMKNFAPIFVALDKSEVELDYRKHPGKVINIFVGPMGSCKTFLLGHHQPFSTLGTLDVRNAEDMILPGKKGIKEIVYRNGDDLFEILHVYSPSKSNNGAGHVTKSYIKKNGNELNENGNANSFRDIIETEFGLEQNFLKLFRIGSNVINLPDMTATERKSFVSSMLADTEIYSLLYRKLGEENRALNAQMTILINKLHSITKMSEDDLLHDRDTEQAIVEEISKDIEATSKTMYQMDGAIGAICGSQSVDLFQSSYKLLSDQIESDEKTLAEKKEQFEEIGKDMNTAELNHQIAECNARIDIRVPQIRNLDMEMTKISSEVDRLGTQLAVIASEDQIDVLRQTYQTLMEQLQSYERQLRNFTYAGTTGSIIAIEGELQNLDAQIAEVAQYDGETIRQMLRNPARAINIAKKEIAKAERERDRIQQEMTNIKQSVLYKPNHLMYRPFGCPTEDCPFYKFHPLTEQKRRRHENVDDVFLKHQNALKKVEAQIYHYDEFPNIARKVESLKAIWKRILPQCQSLGILKEENLEEITTNLMHRNWYDAARLQRIKELCAIREKYYEIVQKVSAMRNELTQYEITNSEQLRKDHRELSAKLSQMVHQMEGLEADQKADEELASQLKERYLRLSMYEMLQNEISTLESSLEGLRSQHLQMKENLDKVLHYQSEIAELRIKHAHLKSDYQLHSSTLERYNRTLDEIRATKAQYDGTLHKQELYHDMLEAVSSKKGIPLVFVRLFLDDCRDIINDLISDVFDDSIEIVRFDIPEDGNEFNIPYTRNGAFIDDIIKSSQGERAIISLALSFALIRQRTFPYNIMLLDEVDGPLDKSARNKFITILFKQLHAIGAEQVFIVSHNNSFDGFNVNVITTGSDVVDENPLTTIMKV